MRARNIKPSFFVNEDLAECEPLERILFIGLWCEADKHGFLEYRPKRLQIEILPYDSCNFVKFLETLSKFNFVSIWCEKEASGVLTRRFIEINNFKKHQRPHPNEYDSGIKMLLSCNETSCNFVKLHETKCRNVLNDECGMMNDECGMMNKEAPPTLRPKKQKPVFVPPSVEAVKAYFLENGYTEVSALRAHKYYSEATPPWTDSEGKPVRSWKSKMVSVWFKDENKAKPKTTMHEKTLKELLS